MKLLIQFPTRNRPERFSEYLHRYISYLAKPLDTLIHISMDTDDNSMNNEEVKQRLTDLRCNYSYYDNKTKHQAVNRWVSFQIMHNDIDIILLASDDMLPVIQGYDEIIRQDMEKFFPDTDGALWYFDGNRRDINTLQIFGRKYYERFGYIYREETVAFFGDTEFQEVAQRLGKLEYIDKCIIKHEHYEWNPSIVRDESYDKNSNFFRKDEEVYNQRKAADFPITRSW